MPEVIYNGKTYKEIDHDGQRMLEAVNIHSFRYYPKDKLWMASDLTCDYFDIEKFYVIDENTDNVGPGIVSDEYREMDLSMYRKLIYEGVEVVSYETRFKNSDGLYKITLAVIERDEDGKPQIIGGVIENYSEQMMQAAVVKMLAADYFSVYFVDFIKDEVTMYKMLDSLREKYEGMLNKKPTYDQAIGTYIDTDVVEEERAEMHKITSKEFLEPELNKKRAYIHDYRIFRNGETRFMRYKIVKLNEGEELINAVVGFTDVTDDKQDKLERLAFFDQVTLGNNYNYYSERLKQENRKGYIVSLDIRDFKVVNNVCGIKQGDEVLREVNRILGRCISDGYYAHVNGDHFVFFLPVENEDAVVTVINDITEAFEDLVETYDIPIISPYFGATMWKPGNRIQVLFSEANTAKHKIKPFKDINYGFYSEADNLEAIEIKKIEDAFYGAIKNKEFEIWFQPKYSPVDKELTGAEALVRWKKDGKIVPPGKFIPIYERNGMIRELDEYVFTNVCIQQRKWINQLGKCVPVSVNLSRASLSWDGIVDNYKQIAEDVGIPAMIIPIEITESAAISNSDIKDLADRFFDAGFPLHIDDFGAGYSSLATLNLMRFDTLKLDKSLIDYIGEFGGDRLVKHTVALAKDLGLYVTAEGVEEESQLLFLKAVECDNIQGYIYSKPIVLSEFEDILKNDKLSERYVYSEDSKAL